MFLESRILFILAESPLHAGTGTGLGAVDLPIQRERSTGYPIIQSSGVKGALRSEVIGDEDKKIAAFGPEPPDPGTQQNAIEHAGALATGDARVLLFPVRSLKGVFAWVTSLTALNRFQRDAVHAGLAVPSLPQAQPASNQAFVSGSGVSADDKLVLEEFAFDAKQNDETKCLAKWLAEKALPQEETYAHWQAKVKSSLVILPEDAFRDFLLYATEVTTRVRLAPDSKTVVPGALWTEEYLPADTLLYAPIRATRLRASSDNIPSDWKKYELAEEQAKAVLDWATDEANIPHWIQIGGNETIGQGIVRLRWNGGAS